jgi:hypothetical protein
VFGDTLHNLRSALDLRTWQAAIAAGGTPGRSTADAHVEVEVTSGVYGRMILPTGNPTGKWVVS